MTKQPQAATLYLPSIHRESLHPAPGAELHAGLGLTLGGPIAGAPADWHAQTLQLLTPAACNNWAWHFAGIPGYLPHVVHLHLDTQNTQDAIAMAHAKPGLTWLLGNEPDLLGYADIPRIVEFARMWARDVGGSWGGFGVVAGEGGCAWLNAYLAAGGPVGDHWHMHVYGVYAPDDWTRIWRYWRAWMKRMDVERPTIVTETCGWGEETDQAAIMDRYAQLLDTEPLLDAVLHYSTYDYWDLWNFADLRYLDGTLTPLGEHFVALRGAASAQ